MKSLLVAVNCLVQTLDYNEFLLSAADFKYFLIIFSWIVLLKLWTMYAVKNTPMETKMW